MHTLAKHIHLIQSGFRYLTAVYPYTQKTVADKLAIMGYPVSESSLSNMLNNTKFGKIITPQAAAGMSALLEAELGVAYQSASQEWAPIPGAETYTVQLEQTDPKHTSTPYTFHADGRLSIQQKVNFMQSAQLEVVEFGLRLNAFVNYFFQRNRQEFRAHIETLLEKGVHIKLFMLDPDSHHASSYFADRAAIFPLEAGSVRIMQDTQIKIKSIQQELAQCNYAGRLEAYTYKHTPSAHFLIVDGASRQGKLLTSSYLFGIRRAECPVLEVAKNRDRELYKKFYDSYLALAKNATKI